MTDVPRETFNPGNYDYTEDTFTDMTTGTTRPMIVVDKSHDVTFPDEVIIELAESSIGFGLNPANVDWDRFYEYLEAGYGYDMQGLGDTPDNRIRKRVGKLRTEGRINW